MPGECMAVVVCELYGSDVIRYPHVVIGTIYWCNTQNNTILRCHSASLLDVSTVSVRNTIEGYVIVRLSDSIRFSFESDLGIFRIDTVLL